MMKKNKKKQAKQIITKTKDKKQAEPKNVKVKSSNPAGLTQVAHSLVGIPYVWGGTTEQGFDCSGFIQYVFASQNVQLPRTVSDMWNFTTPVSTPSVGDIIFFQTYKPGPSHAGIYMGMVSLFMLENPVALK
ncbi:C40 family peptidase [Virgibacillus soli]|uniref:C40 family peptidase n=1 Tax=Paracerasibacillus soli TaxID=480284 RepID=A0ABU5CPJ0_9BACI|nr:C40 family peptidase [Virgibacillus soli]MDY0408272.1 C40 family peptidase [Virgibacillus soli]